jgi:hypothetical protein
MSRVASSASANGSVCGSPQGRLSSHAWPLMLLSPWTETSQPASSGPLCRWGAVVSYARYADAALERATFLSLYDYCTECSCETCLRYLHGPEQSR